MNYVEGIAIKHWHGDLTGLMVEARDVAEKLQKAALKKKKPFFFHIFFFENLQSMEHSACCSEAALSYGICWWLMVKFCSICFMLHL